MSNLFPVFRSPRYNNTKQDPFTFTTLFEDLLNFDDNPRSKYNYSNELPKANVLKSDTGYAIEIAVPGYSRDEFDMSVENNYLIIGLETEDTKDYKEKIIHREYRHQTFKRRFSLPENTNIDAISARYEAGILYVEVPVEDMNRKTRTITVE